MQGRATAASRGIQSARLGRHASRRSQTGGVEGRARHSEHPIGAACHNIWQVGKYCLASPPIACAGPPSMYAMDALCY